MKENINLSFYLMLQNLFSLLSWFLLFAIIEKTGEQNLAASNMARSYYVLFLTPLWAYQASCSSFVSNAIGAGQFSQVPKIVKRMLIVSTVTGIIVILPMLSIPKMIMSVFTESPRLIEIGSRIFYPIALGTLIGTVSQILVTTIAATKNTKFVLIMETISVVAYLIWGYWAAFSFPTQIEITWLGESIYYLMLVIIGGIYIRRKIICS
jgi:Na+-driven multidrug efflux pump